MSRTTLPDKSGKDIVLSAVGLVAVKVVSFVSIEEPSNLIVLSNSKGTASISKTFPAPPDVIVDEDDCVSIVNKLPKVILVVTGTDKLPVIATESLIDKDVESVERIVLPDISTVPSV